MLKVRYFILKDVPDDIRVDTEIVMDQDIAHACDIRPLDLRVLGAQLERQFLHRLTDNLEAADDGTAVRGVLQQLGTIPPCDRPNTRLTI